MNHHSFLRQDIIKYYRGNGYECRLAQAKNRGKGLVAGHPCYALLRLQAFFCSSHFILGTGKLDHNIAPRLYISPRFSLAGYYPAKMALAGLRSRTLNIYTLLVISHHRSGFHWVTGRGCHARSCVYNWGAVAWRPMPLKKPEVL
jgi:hypothetical protein